MGSRLNNYDFFFFNCNFVFFIFLNCFLICCLRIYIYVFKKKSNIHAYIYRGGGPFSFLDHCYILFLKMYNCLIALLIMILFFPSSLYYNFVFINFVKFFFLRIKPLYLCYYVKDLF
jgi:hypothetical protein